MTQIEDSDLLAGVIETLNDHYPDDLLNQAYEMLLDGDDYDLGDTVAVFLVSEIANVIKPGRQSLSSALKEVADHLKMVAEDIRGLQLAIS